MGRPWSAVRGPRSGTLLIRSNQQLGCVTRIFSDYGLGTTDYGLADSGLSAILPRMFPAIPLRRAFPVVLLAVPRSSPFPWLPGRARSGTAQSPPLKSGISLVSLDFLAIGRDGQPVQDLKAEEVSLKVGGRARPHRHQPR